LSVEQEIKLSEDVDDAEWKKELTNRSFRKTGVCECQPDIAFYIGKNLWFPPRNHAPIDLNEIDPPRLNA
jgi:hypothetical protein